MVMTQIFVELKFSTNVTELDGSGSLSSLRRIDKQGQPPADYSENLGGPPKMTYRILSSPAFQS